MSDTVILAEGTDITSARTLKGTSGGTILRRSARVRHRINFMKVANKYESKFDCDEDGGPVAGPPIEPASL